MIRCFGEEAVKWLTSSGFRTRQWDRTARYCRLTRKLRVDDRCILRGIAHALRVAAVGLITRTCMGEEDALQSLSCTGPCVASVRGSSSALAAVSASPSRQLLLIVRRRLELA